MTVNINAASISSARFAEQASAPATPAAGFVRLYANNATLPLLSMINDAGTVTSYLGNSSGSGAGITFPATQSPSTDVNTLDDYEEGPWTPVYQSAGTLPSVIYDPITTGRYTKIGNIVFIIGAIRTDSVSGGSGQVRIGGLPFVAANIGVLRGTLSLGQTDGFAGEMPHSANLRENTQYANLWYRSSVDGATIALDVSDLGTGTDANLLVFSGHYQI